MTHRIAVFVFVLLLPAVTPAGELERGIEAINQKDYDKALEHLSSAIRSDRKCASAYSLRGTVYQSKKEFDNAIEDFDEAIRLDPKASDYLARASAQVGRRDKAQLASMILTVLQSIDDKDKRVVELKAEQPGLDAIIADSSGKIMKDCNEAIRLDPKYASAYSIRGSEYHRKGELDKAMEDCNAAIRFDAKLASAYLARGHCYEGKNKLYAALADYQEAIRIDPTLDDARQNVRMLTAKIKEKWLSPKVTILALNLDRELKKVVTKTGPTIRLSPNSQKTVEDSVTIQHSATVSTGWKAGGEVRGKVSAWWGEVEGALKAGIEKSESKTYGVETKMSRSVVITGSDPTRVIWVDYYRTGKANVRIDDQEFELPFEFLEDFDLLTEKAP